MHWCLVLIWVDCPDFIIVSVLVVGWNLVCPVPSCVTTLAPKDDPPKLVEAPKVLVPPVVAPPPKLKEEFCCCCCWFAPPNSEGVWVPPPVLKRPPDPPNPVVEAVAARKILSTIEIGVQVDPTSFTITNTYF